jgi:hypothetical protein
MNNNQSPFTEQQNHGSAPVFSHAHAKPEQRCSLDHDAFRSSL